MRITKQRTLDSLEVEKYSSRSDSDLFRPYETVRLAPIDLVAGLPQ